MRRNSYRGDCTKSIEQVLIQDWMLNNPNTT